MFRFYSWETTDETKANAFFIVILPRALGHVAGTNLMLPLTAGLKSAQELFQTRGSSVITIILALKVEHLKRLNTTLLQRQLSRWNPHDNLYFTEREAEAQRGHGLTCGHTGAQTNPDCPFLGALAPQCL